MEFLIVSASALVISVAALIIYYIKRGVNNKNGKKILGINLITIFSLLIFTTIILFAKGSTSFAAGVEESSTVNGLGLIAAALSTGLATIGAGIAVAVSGSAALGAISEDSSLLGKTLIFVGLAEGIAIYGLIVSILILGRI